MGIPIWKKLIFHRNIGDAQKRYEQVNPMFTLGTDVFSVRSLHGVIYHFDTPQETINDFAFLLLYLTL